jgi:hypothetical protein
MYTVEDETFQQARSILVALSHELDAQQAAGSRRPVDLHELVRRSAPGDLAESGEADHLRALTEEIRKCFPISELFPRKRRS